MTVADRRGVAHSGHRDKEDRRLIVFIVVGKRIDHMFGHMIYRSRRGDIGHGAPRLLTVRFFGEVVTVRRGRHWLAIRRHDLCDNTTPAASSREEWSHIAPDSLLDRTLAGLKAPPGDGLVEMNVASGCLGPHLGAQFGRYAVTAVAGGT